jgi:hypothetical protein
MTQADSSGLATLTTTVREYLTERLIAPWVTVTPDGASCVSPTTFAAGRIAKLIYELDRRCDHTWFSS